MLPHSTFQAITLLFHITGLALAPFALWRSRTPQGAFAWVVALLAFPYVAVPAFAVFGRKRFYGYVMRRQLMDAAAQKELKEMQRDLREIPGPVALDEFADIVRRVGQIGFTDGNLVDLLVDGEETYDAMLAAIQSAKQYLLFQTYIFRPDQTGQKFRDALVEKAREGVKVYVLYDRVGTSFPKKFTKTFDVPNLEIVAFEGTRSLFQHFQINFRNHRKLIIADGKVALLGGLNIGDEYLGLKAKWGPWRDTHLRIAGPAAAAAQLSFIKDWHWAKSTAPDLDWNVPPLADGCPAVVFHTGPADTHEGCNLAHISLINAARERLWLATPYFVPPDGLANALALAAIRGVDVRIILPKKTDNRMAQLASEVHAAKLQTAGVKFYRFDIGFMHQKVLLCDRLGGMVGSVNLDSRSFFINFELMCLSDQSRFLDRLEAMFAHDFARSQVIPQHEFENSPWLHQLAGRAATLAGPML